MLVRIHLHDKLLGITLRHDVAEKELIEAGITQKGEIIRVQKYRH